MDNGKLQVQIVKNEAEVYCDSETESNNSQRNLRNNVTKTLKYIKKPNAIPYFHSKPGKLPYGSVHRDAKISYFEGPELFYVHLQKNAADFQIMKHGLASLEDLKLHYETPCVGQAVLAHSKAHQLSRCVVTKINSVSNTSEIFHVDYGDREVVPLESLFQIPEHYMKIRIMASPLKMSKLVELPKNISENVVKSVFAELIENDTGLSIEVDSGSDNQFSLQTVVVWNSKKNNILYEMLEKLEQIAIPKISISVSEQEKPTEAFPMDAEIYITNHINKNFRVPEEIPANTQLDVMIIFWDSPFEFFVRPCNQRSAFEHFKFRLNKIYKEAVPSTSTFKINDCVVVRTENNFHRGLILEMSQNSQFYVQLVDIGQNITCDKTALYNILSDELIETPFFAIRCSLNRIVPAFESTIEEEKLKCVTDLLNRENLFPCKFLGMVKQRYMVKLKLGSSDLKTQLIEKKMVSNLPKTVDLDVLVGQIIEVEINYIESIFSFFATLKSSDTIGSLPLACGYIDENKGRHADKILQFRDFYVNKHILVKVIAVTHENKLLLSLHMLNDFVKPTILCDPILSRTFNVNVEHCDGLNVVYVRSSTDRPNFNTFIEDVTAYFENDEQPFIENLEVNGVYACKASVNGKWYRTIVIEIYCSKRIKIQYIDWGITEIVRQKRLRLLPDSFMNVKRTLLKLYLPLKNVETTSGPGNCVEKLTSFLDMPMELKLNAQHKDCWMGTLSRREVRVEKLMVFHGMADIISFAELRSYIDAQEPIMCLNTTFDVEKAEFGVMTFALNPENFYILLVNDVNKRNALQEKLKYMSSTLPDIGTVKVGSICVAPSKSRNFWGRAKIVKSPDPTQISLAFIDFGFTDSIEFSESSMLKMNPEDCEPYVRLCSLAVKNTNAFDDVWEEKATKIIEDLVEKEVFIEVLAKTRQKYFVSMFRHNENIGDILTNRGLARYQTIPIFEQNDKFMIQNDDQLSLTEFSIVSETHVDPINCTIELPSKSTRWPVIADHKFKEYVVLKQVFQVELVELRDSRIVVDLLFDEQQMSLTNLLRNYCCQTADNEINRMIERFNQNIDDYFKGLVRVVSFITLQDFYISYKASECLVTEIENMLSQIYLEELAEPVIDEVCATRICGDESYKRAKILSIENGQYHVRFIDYGKTTVAYDFRKLPKSLQEFPPIALQCQYVKTEMFTNEESTSDVTGDKYAKFSKHDTLYMDIRDHTTQPITVELLKLTPLLHQKKKRRRECKSPIKDIDDKKLLKINPEKDN